MPKSFLLPKSILLSKAMKARVSISVSPLQLPPELLDQLGNMATTLVYSTLLKP